MSKILTRLPSHDMYIELLSGDRMNLMRKVPRFSEVYNDQRSLVTDFFKVLRDSTEDFKRYIVENDESVIENNNVVSVERWKELRDLYIYFNRDCIEGNLNSCTGFRDVTSEVEEELLSIDDKLLYMVKRLRMVQYENRPYTDIINRFDKPTTVFYIDISRIDDLGVSLKELCFNLLKVKGKCVIYGSCDSEVYDILIDEGWIEVKDEKSEESCWLNYRI